RLRRWLVRSLGLARQQCLGHVQRSHQFALLRRRERAQHGADLPGRTRLDRSERLATAFGERQQALPGVDRRVFLADKAELLEAPQNAAEVAGVEVEIAADVGCG